MVNSKSFTTEIAANHVVRKGPALDVVSSDRSALSKYQDFFIGSPQLLTLVRFELAAVLASSTPGALGYMLRKVLYRGIFHRVGKGVQWGRNLALRHPEKIVIGDRTVIDDNCVLDARGVRAGELSVGDDVLIARDCLLLAKTNTGFIRIGSGCTIGNGCTIGSPGGVTIGNKVGVAANCYIGGGRYEFASQEVPIIDQKLYSAGETVIEEDCLIGAGVIVLDGVTIGAGSVIGAGSLIREDVPAGTVVTPHQRLIMLPRMIPNASR